ncbi:MAG: NUDIX domain-containing protein [Acidimicrobiia bacterium]
MAPDPVPAPVPAATVVLVRDGEAGVEVLMLRRDSRVAFGGMWAFPGGRIEPDDLVPGDEQAGARRAAVREAAEECGLALPAEGLVPFAFWVPPPTVPRRFATWFFLAGATATPVTVDDGEIREHRWLAPGAVLDLHRGGEVDLAAPTWITLDDLAGLPDVDTALAAARDRAPLPRYATRAITVEGGMLACWEGDAAYAGGDLAATGGRNRLWMVGARWRREVG